MNDTRVTIIGTALTQPERRVTEKTGTVVTSFRVVSNSRRFDKATEQWIDSGMFRVRVNCWRRLAEHVVKSISVGDPIVVSGRINTREWKTDQGELRASYEVDADVVGHDLARGVSTFVKTRYEGPSSVVEDDETDSRVHGELTHPFEDVDGSEVPAEAAADAMELLRRAERDATPMAFGTADPGDEEETDEDDLVGAGPGVSRRRRGR